MWPKFDAVPFKTGESRSLPERGGRGLDREESCRGSELPDFWDEAAVDPWEEVSLSSATLRALSDLTERRRQSCGCEGDWLVRDWGEVFTRSPGTAGRALEELLGVAGL